MRYSVLLLTVLVACKDPGPSTKVTTRSTDDATKPIVDNDYQFELAWPGASWKLLHEHDSKRFSPDAIAGAMQQDTILGVVIVEAAPGVELGPFVDLVVRNMPLANKQVETRENIEFASTHAVRFTVTGVINDIQLRYVEIVFTHDGFAYQLIAWGPPGKLSSGAPEAKAFFDAFHLRPGKVHGRAPRPVLDARGPGWRVTKGEFQSGVTELRVKPPAGWHLLIGDALKRVNAEAEIGLEHVDPDVYIIAISERAPAPELRPSFIAAQRARIGGADEGTFAATFAGHPLELSKVRTPGVMGFSYLHAADIHDGRLAQILAWYFPGDRERATKIVQQGLDAFDYLPREQADAVVAELASQPDVQTAVGDSFALRRGTFHSFANDWSWTAPQGSTWRISTGDQAHAANANAELMVNEPNANLYVLAFSEPTAATPLEYHQQVATVIGGRRSKPAPAEVAGAPNAAYSSTSETTTGPEPLRFRLITAVAAGRALRFVVWATPEDLDRSHEVIDAAISGLRLEHQPKTEQVAGEYVDHRLGFAVKVPSGDVQRDESPQTMSGISSTVTWNRGSHLAAQVVVTYIPDDDEAWTLDFMEQQVIDHLGASSDISHSELKLAGVTARRLSIAGLDCYLLVRDHIVYAYLTSEHTPDGFRLLP